MKNTMIQNQKYGVEIEMTGISRKQAAEEIAKVLGSRIRRIDPSGYNTHYVPDSKSRDWKVMYDSSINATHSDGSRASDDYKVEVVTPPLEYSDLDTLQKIIRALREAGAKSSNSCGIHVHVDGANHTPESLRRLLNLFVGRQDLIYEALNIGQRGNRWCKKINKRLFSEMKKDKALNRAKAERIWYSEANDGYRGGIDHSHYCDTRYHGVNLHAFFTKGTVEFRLFNSTLHAGKIKAYIQFCLAMSGWAILSADHIVFKNISSYTPEQKVTIMRNFLKNRLGLTGSEYKTCRIHMLANLRKAAGIEMNLEEAA